MLKKAHKGALFILEYFGFYPNQLIANMRGLLWWFRDYSKIKRQVNKVENKPVFGMPIPIFKDKADGSGNLSGHYFHQDLLVAQRIFANNPQRHVDIGSRTDGFVTHVASFREIEVIDIRESDVEIRNIRFIQDDFMSPHSKLLDYADSVSCLHVIEHFGLGRYGDPIDIDGHWKGLSNIYKLLKKGGKFYFSTPIGPEKIHFNAHRVFNISTLVAYLEKDYYIDDFAYVDDKGSLHLDADVNVGKVNNFNCKFGCGIFELTKK